MVHLRTIRRPSRQCFRPRLEELESRYAPATSLDPAQLGPVVNPHVLGVNVASWDYYLSDNQATGGGVTPDGLTVDMVRQAGLGFFRFSNGSGADEWHWADPGTFDRPIGAALLANFATAAGGDALVNVNFGTGTPQEAAAYVAYLNGRVSNLLALGTDSTGKNWKTVSYWANLRGQQPLAQDDGLNFLRAGHPEPFGFHRFEVGNEPYFGAWQGYVTPSPTAYVTFARQFATLARQVDPLVQVGLGVGNPGEWDDIWTIPVLQTCVAQNFTPGFLSDHFFVYDGALETVTDSELLHDTINNPNSANPIHGNSPRDWAGRAEAYRALLTQYLGQAGSQVKLVCAEFNSDADASNEQSTSLVRGLFLADALGGVLSTEYQGVAYWNLRNGYTSIADNPDYYGWRDGTDSGMIGSTGTAPFTGPYIAYPSYFAEQLASKLIRKDGQVVAVQTDNADLGVFAVKQANGHVVLLVINKSATQDINETFTISGFGEVTQATLWQYGKAEDEAQRVSGTGAASLTQSSPNIVIAAGSFQFAFPAYSMSVLDLSDKTDTTVTVTAPDTAAVGQNVTLTATLAAAGATGTVEFRDGTTVLGSAPVVDGVATFNTTALKVGYHPITATYSGDATFNPSLPSAADTVKITGVVTVKVVRSAITLDRVTKRATQTFTFVNNTAEVIPLPLTLRFKNLTATVNGVVKRIGVVGQTGVIGRDPLLLVNRAAGATELAPGDSFKVKVFYNIKNTVKVRYTLVVSLA